MEQKMKTILNIAFISSLLISSFSCNNNPVIQPEYTPGRRDYVWTTDTLDMEVNFIHTIWGSSANDVWAMGAGGNAQTRLWHFDGSNWSVSKEAVFCGAWSLFGFSANNVWMGGDDELSNGASIWHYDGKSWSPNYFYKIQGAYLVSIMNIYGASPNDIYACGIIDYDVQGKASYEGFVLHYNGTEWKEVVRGNINDLFTKIAEENNKAYIYAIKHSPLGYDTLSFYELDGSRLDTIYSNSEGNINWINFFQIGGKLYFLIDKNVCLYQSGKFITQFSINEPNFSYYLFGRNEKDIFINMKDGLAHYNGEDIEYLLHYPENSRSFGEAAVFGKDVFQVYYDHISGKNMVLHGKLKN